MAPDRLVCLREPAIVKWKNEIQVYFRVSVYRSFWEEANESDSRWRVYRTISRDGGKNWSTPAPLEIPNIDSKLCVATLPDDRLVIAYNTNRERFPLVVATSSDGGLTWQDEGKIAVGPCSMGYPTLIVDYRGLVHLSYSWKRREIAYALLDFR